MADTRSQISELNSLRALSARMGADPLLVQGAGGNTSIKIDDTLWIKASGTWLAEAIDRDILIPVDMPPLLKAVAEVDPIAEQAQAFVKQAPGIPDLRPSIETTVHALVPQRVVLHSHCVDTISHAVRTDCVERIAPKLAGLKWAYIPYGRPGLPLAVEINRTCQPDHTVLILGNHGLVVAADTVTEAEALQTEVKSRLSVAVRSAPPPGITALKKRIEAAPTYRLPDHDAAHAIALHPDNLAFARHGIFYPDDVIFLGESHVVAETGEDIDAVCARTQETPVSIIFPGEGIVMRKDAPPGADAMARCLSDVAARVASDAPLRPLTSEEIDQLTNWDAEKYRQRLAQEAEIKPDLRNE